MCRLFRYHASKKYVKIMFVYVCVDFKNQANLNPILFTKYMDINRKKNNKLLTYIKNPKDLQMRNMLQVLQT